MSKKMKTLEKSKLKQKIINGLRRLHLRSSERYAIIKGARISRGVYGCEECNGIFKAKEIHVDHIEPIRYGEWDWNHFIEELFYGECQALCKQCHKIKTKQEKEMYAKAKKKT